VSLARTLREDQTMTIVIIVAASMFISGFVLGLIVARNI
jgi:hypothetical protein